jgi:hypothetical protein
MLYREIEQLREQCQALPEVGDLFAGVDRLLRDVLASEAALSHMTASQGAAAAEGALLAAQRCGIDHALLDIEVAVAAAVHARRKANGTYGRMELAADGERWIGQVGPVLLDWSSASVDIAPDDNDIQPDATIAVSPDRVASELQWLARQDPLDLCALRRTVTRLRNLRAAWGGSGAFGEVLCAGFRRLLRQPHGRRWLGALAVTAAAMSETACAHALFEGWLMEQGSASAGTPHSPILALVLARLAFESHLEAGQQWVENPAASMCQYLLSGRLTPMETLLASTGSLLGVAGDLDHTLTQIAHSFRDLTLNEASEWVPPLSRTVWLALFLQIGRRSPLQAIPSLAELPGRDGLFETLLDRRHEAVVYRLVPSQGSKVQRGEHYELRPGTRIEPLLMRRFGDTDMRLEMPVSDEFERRHVASTAQERWQLGAASPTSFLGELEAAASLDG